MYTEDLIFVAFGSRQEEFAMLECIKHRAKSTGESNKKIYDGGNACGNEKSSREPQKTEKGK